MEQYIPKSKVIEEIKSYKDNFCDRNGYLEDVETNGLAYDTLCELENSIDTLEVKEMDLEKELQSFFYPHVPWGDYCKNEQEDIEEWSFKIAKHFFELGLRYKSSYVSIPSIDDTLKEMGVDPDSKDGMDFKVHYYRALDEFKAQKRE